MRKILFLSVALSTLPLAGCIQSKELAAQQAKEDEAKCVGVGAKPGTELMVNCRLYLLRQREAQAERNAAALQAVGSALIAGSAARQPAPSTMVTCTSYGRTTTCM